MNAPILAPCFLALSESRELAARVAAEAQLALASLEERSFDGGEFKLRPLESVRGRIAFVLQSLAGTAESSVSERFVRLLFLLNGLRDAGAERRIALVPYLAYARKDRRTQIRDPVHTRYVAQLIEASGVDRLVALDVHNPAALDNAFRIPVDHLSALPMFADHFARRVGDAPLAVASPDVGGIKRVQLFRELLEERLGREVELAFIEKRRAAGVVSGGTLVGMTANRPTVIVLDDLCATGGTLIRAASVCRAAGAAAVHVAVTHVPLASGVDALSRSEAISGIVATDSVGIADHRQRSSSVRDKLVTLSIAPLLGQAVRRMLTGKPLAPLLRRWPPAEE
ncbi:MAG TPA: ribose-phosphate diphosphokinase [Steroidobacteraceae bacterium]|nr:ribose-phosphate diphosphokinase [Steroidobacteraceae bacterium]